MFLSVTMRYDRDRDVDIRPNPGCFQQQSEAFSTGASAPVKSGLEFQDDPV